MDSTASERGARLAACIDLPAGQHEYKIAMQLHNFYLSSNIKIRRRGSIFVSSSKFRLMDRHFREERRGLEAVL
jgi:hypothetical protein